MEVSTSILSINKEDAIQEFYNLEVAQTDYFHIDVMDGKFVKQSTIQFMNESAHTIKHISSIPLDVHLMVQDVDKFVEEYIPLLPSIITFHIESFDDGDNNKFNKVKDTINKIRNEGIKVGVSIKPDTTVSKIEPIIELVNLVLVMTVEPGLGGQKLIEKTVDKISELYQYREKNGLDFYIEADGGINLDNVDLIKKAGTDIVVCGVAIVKAENKAEVITKMKE